jgi:hypothetical protein
MLQKLSALATVFTAFLSLLYTIHWMEGENKDDSYLGGLNWNKLIFNWHPIFMVAGLIFCSGKILYFI